jgi:hypothetical protein
MRPVFVKSMLCLYGMVECAAVGSDLYRRTRLAKVIENILTQELMDKTYSSPI